VAAHTFSSKLSQDDADQQAIDAATTQAQTQCSQHFLNTIQQAPATLDCRNLQGLCHVFILYTVQAGQVSSTSSQLDANKKAFALAQQKAQEWAALYCNQNKCGNFNLP
jgi:hypothetical protein